MKSLFKKMTSKEEQKQPSQQAQEMPALHRKDLVLAQTEGQPTNKIRIASTDKPGLG